MTPTTPDEPLDALTRTLLLVVRANGLLVSVGDSIADHEGLTAARWQVLGAVRLAGRPLTVPQIARRIGLTRQTVHPTVRALVDGGLLAPLPNADHRRSALIALTDRGNDVDSALARRQAAWAGDVAAALCQEDLEVAATVLEALCERLDLTAEQHRPGASVPAPAEA